MTAYFPYVLGVLVLIADRETYGKNNTLSEMIEENWKISSNVPLGKCKLKSSSTEFIRVSQKYPSLFFIN